MEYKYHVYKWLCSDYLVVCIDEKQLRLYNNNIYNQCYNLDNPNIIKIDNRNIKGAIRRLNKSYMNSKAIDKYIIKHFVSEQNIDNILKIYISYIDKEHIFESNNYSEILKFIK